MFGVFVSRGHAFAITPNYSGKQMSHETYSKFRTFAWYKMKVSVGNFLLDKLKYFKISSNNGNVGSVKPLI